MQLFFRYSLPVPKAPLTDDELDAWRALLQTHAALFDVLERELIAEHDMPLAYYEVLVNLSENGGRMRMSDLADRVLLSRSGLTRLIDRMTTAGYVDRETCPSDRRGSYAVLTAAGMTALKKAWPSHARGVAEHFAKHLDKTETKQLTAILRRISDPLGPTKTGACGGA